MSRKSRRRNQILGALALGIGASKLGMLGGKTDVSKMITSDGGGKDASKMMTKVKPIAKPVITKKIPGRVVDKDVISSGPFKMFSAKNKTAGGKKFSDESIAKFKEANKRQIERRAKLKMGKSDRTDVPGFFGMKFDKPVFNKGSMVKARGGGMARTKPTKLS